MVKLASKTQYKYLSMKGKYTGWKFHFKYSTFITIDQQCCLFSYLG